MFEHQRTTMFLASLFHFAGLSPRTVLSIESDAAAGTTAGGGTNGAAAGGTTNGAAGEGAAGDGRTKVVERTFSQDDLNRVVGREVGKIKTRAEAAERKAAEMEQKLAEFDALRARLEEIETRDATKGATNEHERKAIEYERDLKKIRSEHERVQKELAAAAKRAADAETGLSSYMIRARIGEGLASAKVLPRAMEQAIRLLAAEGNARIEDGKVVLSVGELDFVDDPKGAAIAWLRANPHFALAAGGGAGIGDNSNGSGGGGAVRNPTDNDPESLIAAGWASRPKGGAR